MSLANIEILEDKKILALDRELMFESKMSKIHIINMHVILGSISRHKERGYSFIILRGY